MGSTTEILFKSGWSWTHLFLAIILLALFLGQAYRWLIIPIPPKQRVLLFVLRISWSLLLLWSLWEPFLQKTTQHKQPVSPRVVVMVDVSSSMNLSSKKGEDRWQKLLETTERLQTLISSAKVQEASWFALGSQLRSWSPKIPPKDSQSLIVRQLSEVAESQSKSSSPTTLFLLSDGQDTMENPVSNAILALRAHHIRVFPIILEGNIGPQSLSARLERIHAPQDVFLNQAFELNSEIKLQTGHPTDFIAILEKNSQEIARQTAHHKGTGIIQISFPLQAEKVGVTLYTVRLQQSGSTSDLSRLSVAVRTKMREANHVLYAQGSPDWEYRFIRQAIHENPSIILDGITQLNDQAFLHQVGQAESRPPENSSLAAFQAALRKSDVVVLANLNPEILDSKTQKLLLEFVQNHGGGILFFTGNSKEASRFHTTLLEELLPVTLEAASPPIQDDSSSANLWAMQLTPEGLASEIWRDATTANKPLPQPPPTFIKFVEVKGVKLGATILGQHSTKKNGSQPKPLFACQNIGAGRSVFLGIDALWRWRMQEQVENRDYDRFWQQLFLWLGGRVQGTSLQTNREHYQPGETVHVQLHTIKSSSLPHLFVSDRTQHKLEVPLTWNQPNTDAQAEYQISNEGEIIFTLESQTDVLAMKITDVRSIDLEKEFSGLNEVFLQQLARESGGKCLSTKDLDLIPHLLKTEKEIRTQHERIPLWHSPWIFITILMGYSAELLLRKKFQLT